MVSIALMQSCASKEEKVKQNTEISSSNEDIENSSDDDSATVVSKVIETFDSEY